MNNRRACAVGDVISQMALLRNLVYLIFLASCVLAVQEGESSGWYAYDNSFHIDDIRLLESRVKRSAVGSVDATVAPEIIASNLTVKSIEAASLVHTANASSSGNTSTPSAPVVTQKNPNVGVNGSGIHKDVSNPPKVSDPIISEQSYNSTVEGDIHSTPKVTPEVLTDVNADENTDNLTKIDYDYYHSTFIGQQDYFNELWANVTKMNFTIHPILSSSHRRATTTSLDFDFPFYGLAIKNVIVTTGGFVYTGQQVHNWLAATQYIAPLMANFDTTASNFSVIKIANDGFNFTVVWENVTLQNYNQSFTFALTLRKDGDILFIYKDIPIPVQLIDDKDHPVKVGISDAYVNDRVLFMKRRKTIYEYHRINFLKHNITNGTVLNLHPNPTCMIYTGCNECISHKIANSSCFWCPASERCFNDDEKKKREWLHKGCTKDYVATQEECSFLENRTKPVTVADVQNKTKSVENKDTPVSSKMEPVPSSMGGVVVLLIVLGFISFSGGWVFYAYKNPHTWSGQVLIKYRPSTWSWKRGEARYTAATIHM